MKLLMSNGRSGLRRTMMVPIVVGVLGLVLAACSSSTPSHPSAVSHHKKFSVAFIPGATGVSFYDSMEIGAAREAKALGMSFSYEGAPDFTPSAQTPVVDAVCARHPSALLVAPTDPVAMRPAIQQCLNEGVKVGLVDTSLTNKQGIFTAITSDNVQGGEAAGKIICTYLHGKGQVGVMSLSATATTQVERVAGLKQYLSSSCPGVSIVAEEYVAQVETSSVTEASAILSAHPQVKAFFGAAEPNAEGAAAAVRAAGLQGKVLVVGYDGGPTEYKLLEQGQIGALVIQQPALEGKLGVQYAYDALTGHTSSIRASVQLPNVVATTANATSASVKKYEYSNTTTP